MLSAPVNSSFQAKYFSVAAYDLALDSIHCFTYCKAVKDGRALASGVTEQTYVVKRLKDSMCSFSKHESCDFHKVCATALTSTV